jgi:hypothetical protein
MTSDEYEKQMNEKAHKTLRHDFNMEGVVYSSPDLDIQHILAAAWRMNNGGFINRLSPPLVSDRTREMEMSESFYSLRTVKHKRQESALKKADYLRGIAATLSDPSYLLDIADVLEEVGQLFDWHIKRVDENKKDEV